MTQQRRTDDRNDQAEVIAFLADPSSYADVDQVERFETHGNLVFRAGSDAWKIKRAIRFSYMDFSTLEKRAAACAREMEVNHRLAPELYIGCVPITRAGDGRLSFAGSGDILEWAVHMRRFDQSALLSSIASAADITPDLANAVADTVFDSHRAATRASPISGSAQMAKLVTSLGEALAGSQGFDAEDVNRFSRDAHGQLRRTQSLLNARALQGCVRRCHGDLHLGNIVLWQGRPTLFDAIEFDEKIATTDTLYDLAFLLMDLDSYRQKRAANIVLNRYLWRSKDELDLQGLQALPLFLGLRASIRAMVTVDRAAQEDSMTAEANRERAVAYLHAAVEYLATAAAAHRRWRFVWNRQDHPGGGSCAGVFANPGCDPSPKRSGAQSLVRRRRDHAACGTVLLSRNEQDRLRGPVQESASCPVGGSIRNC
jgi:aminoglycoside phosphotransferase family enzyme